MINKIKKTLKDAGGTVKAPFQIAKSRKEIKKVDRDLPDLKLANQTKHLDTSDMDYRDPIFRARATMSRYEEEYAQKRAKSARNR